MDTNPENKSQRMRQPKNPLPVLSGGSKYSRLIYESRFIMTGSTVRWACVETPIIWKICLTEFSYRQCPCAATFEWCPGRVEHSQGGSAAEKGRHKDPGLPKELREEPQAIKHALREGWDRFHAPTITPSWLKSQPL